MHGNRLSRDSGPINRVNATAQSGTVLCEERQGIAVITLNRPQALNALNGPLLAELRAALQLVATTGTVRAVVLTGAGRGFSAGADLTELPPGGEKVERMLTGEFWPALDAITQLPKPVIAAVEGFASGIAAAFVCASDLVVMSESAFLHLPFLDIGLVPDGGLCWLLARRLGHQRAFEFAADAQRLSATECRQLGLTNRVVKDGTAITEACDWANRLASRSALALAGVKQALRQSMTASFEDIVMLEARLQRANVEDPVFREGVRAFFEKRSQRRARE